jgi:phosphatidylserine decarboxylase
MAFMAIKEARSILIFLGFITLVCLFLFPWVAIVPFALILFVLYFFRNPHRDIPTDLRAIVSGADGKVISISEEEDRWFGNGKMKRIAIFLSVFDVHLNRAPATGRIKNIIYEAGEFLDARNPIIDQKNEAQTWLFETDNGPMVVRQIAGLIARKIVKWKQAGEQVHKGDLIGLIKFGSRTDIYLPLDCEICVKAGQRVQGGSTVIAFWKNNV